MKKSKLIPFVKKVRAKQKGASIILVMVLGAVAIAMAMAAMEPLLIVLRYLSGQDYQQRVASAAENAAQYSIAYIKDKAEISGLGTSEETIILPPDITEQMQITAVLSAPLSITSLQNTAVFHGRDEIEQWQGVPSGNKPQIDFRRLQVNAKSGSFGYSITLILKGNQFETNDFFQTVPSTTNQFFNNAILSSKAVINGSVTINGGDLVATSPKGNQTTIEGSKNATVNGNVYHSPDTVVTNLKPEGEIEGNVFGPDGFGGNPGEVQPTLDSKTSMMPPAPSSPDSNYTNLGSVNLSGTQENPTTLTLAPGDYVASSLNLGDYSNLQVSGSSTSNPGVRIFIDGSSSATSSITLSNTANVQFIDGSVKSPNNLQIFYNGSKPVDIKNSMTSLIYAPNSEIKIDTNHGDFNGAVVGNSVTISGTGKFNYDSQAANPSSPASGVAPGPYFVPFSKSRSYSVVSWSESKI